MNSFRLVLFLVSVKCLFLAPIAIANANREAAVAQELTVSDDENQNADSTSRWSKDDEKSVKPKMVQRAVPLSPISESSFQSGASRSPASAPEGGGGRSPATVSVAEISPTENGVHAKTWTRTLSKRKIYQEVAIIANDLGFFPSTIFVTQGVPVKLFVTGASAKSQCFMMDAFGVRRQIQSQKIEEVTFTPDQSGVYVFTCPINGAKGTLLVKELELGRLPASVVEEKTAKTETGASEKDESSFEK